MVQEVTRFDQSLGTHGRVLSFSFKPGSRGLYSAVD